ncbi:Amiloride-sensitive sodium channel [Ancylostoma ceylanicum]|uniref:Amiloride-sensitive sodium channel n=1 Tax=Ancylostoma ceylanicum TaxID=53326 RepID=A0A0D6M6F0_9BILA|nr:Amiloride-sensitive sodium channel [Ancylostoma ceylanicum]
MKSQPTDDDVLLEVNRTLVGHRPHEQFNPLKIHKCLNGHRMEEEDDELGSTSTYSDDDTQRIVLHVYDDESREFASLTTYHGMIRIYSSETWPSRIFWSLVVVTCLTLFMIHKLWSSASTQVIWQKQSVLKRIHLKANEWGDCMVESFPNVGGRYDRENCEIQCSVEHYKQQCGCIPFFAEKQDGRECTLAEMATCRRKELLLPGGKRGCLCPVECEKIDYTYSPVVYIKKHHRNRSSIEIQMLSRHLEVNEQLKRIKAVDLLSYVAGSMGLFLGMSCVTLLEIFVYLFKSVWGVFNDQRHKTYYLENLLGMNDADSSADSHEEIVITTKTRGDVAAVPPSERSSLTSIAEHESTDFKENVHRHSRVKIEIVRHPMGRRRSSYAQHLAF